MTATGTVTLEEAEKILTAKKVEKLLLVDENYSLTGLITIKDIDMMKRFPQCLQRQAGQAAGRGRGRRVRLRAGGKPDRQGRGRAGGRQCPRAFGQRDRDGPEHQEALGHRRRRGQRGHRRRLQGPDRGRGRRREGRHRSGVDLHDARDFAAWACRRSRRFTKPPRPRETAARRSSPTAAFATRET